MRAVAEMGSEPHSSDRRPAVILMGLRGSGKTTVARALADRLGCSWVDLDEVTLEEFGDCPTIAEVFAGHGEAAFREAEVRALARTLTERGTRVLALGGGTPTAPGAAQMLRGLPRSDWMIAYLHCPPGVLRERIAGDTAQTGASRPSLTGGDPAAEMQLVFDLRDGLYQELADVVVDSSRSVEDVTAQIVGVLGG